MFFELLVEINYERFTSNKTEREKREDLRCGQQPLQTTIDPNENVC